MREVHSVRHCFQLVIAPVRVVMSSRVRVLDDISIMMLIVKVFLLLRGTGQFKLLLEALFLLEVALLFISQLR